MKFHLTHAKAILCIVNAAYCLILYLLARKQQQNSSLSLNKEFLKAAKVISTTISAILAPSANKMDHLQLIRKRHVCRLGLMQFLSYDNVVVAKKKNKKTCNQWRWWGRVRQRVRRIREVDLGRSA